MEDIEPTEAEREQMRKFDLFRRTAVAILAKWAWLLALVFLAVTIAAAVYVNYRASHSLRRYISTTKLVFSPRSAAKIQPMGERQLLGVLDRGSIKRSVAERMSLSPSEQWALPRDLSVEQVRKPSNMFSVTAKASSRSRAKEKANAYAAALIDEYVDYRTRDLKRWDESIEQRKAGLMQKISSFEAEETLAKTKTGAVSPVETLTLLNSLVSDQRRNLSRLGVDLASAKAKKARLEAEIGDIGPAVAACAQEIRKKTAQRADIDAELAKLRKVYTDANPKVKGKLDDRRELEESFLSLLKDNGLADVGLADVERVEKAAQELADVVVRIESIEEGRGSLEAEIAANERQIESLVTAVPALERARAGRDEAIRTLRDLEEEQGNLHYLAMAAAGDLRQIEPATEAADWKPSVSRCAAMAACAGLAATACLAFWLLALEFAFGKVRGAGELGFGGDVEVLGSLPETGRMPPEREAAVSRAVATAASHTDVAKGIVLIYRLAGAEVPAPFREAVEWTFAMAGRRGFGLRLVPGDGFEPPEGAETLAGVVRKDDRGWFPCADLRSLDAAEIRMLRADLETLRRDYDDVFVELPPSFRRAGPFLDQAMGLADGVLLFARAGSSPRRELAAARRRAAAAGRPVAGIAVGAGARAIRREMEEKQ